jgi:hypothetical protein
MSRTALLTRLSSLRVVPGGMDERVLSPLGELRRKLQGQIGELVEQRSGLEGQLQALDKQIDSRRRMLELVEATESQFAGPGPGQPDVEGGEPGASTQEVRGLAKLQDWQARVFTGGLYSCCDSPRQQTPSSGPDPRRPRSSRRLSPSPRGPSLWRCGRTTCCRC